MCKKGAAKQVILALIASILILGGICGFVWQLLKIDFSLLDFGEFNIKLFLIFILMITVGGNLIRAAQKVVPSTLGAMTGEQFEQYIASILRREGHVAKLTPRSGDYGVDIIMDNCVAIQCKRYSGSVGLKAVQEVYAGMMHYGCSRAIVVTNSRFTKSAFRLAKELDVALWDGKAIQKMM